MLFSVLTSLCIISFTFIGQVSLPYTSTLCTHALYIFPFTFNEAPLVVNIIIIIFVFRLLLIIVHTKARVRRYQQLNPSNMSYLVHLPSLVRAFSCHPSHTSSMSSYSPPSLHHLPPLNVCT